MESLTITHNSIITAEDPQVGAELIYRWISYIDASPKTVETYTKSIRRFAAWLSDNGIRQPQREDIISYREWLKRDHKPTTVQAYMAAVKLFFQWTAQEGIYPDVAQRIKGAKLDTAHKKDYLTTKQVNRLLAGIDRETLKGKRDYAMISLMVTTGLREISVVRANTGDIRAAGDHAALYYQGKGHEEKADFVYLSEPVENAIRDYLRARGSAGAESPLFGSIANRNSGERMTTKSVSRMAKERLCAVGLESDRLTGHSLRHTAATLNLLNGASMEETQQLLGHKNINTTLIYAHALSRANNHSEERISKAIFG